SRWQTLSGMTPEFRHLLVFQASVAGGHPSVDEARLAVEEAEPQDIADDELPARHEKMQRGDTIALLDAAFGHHGRVSLDFRPMLVEIGVWKMQNRALQAADRALDFDAFMNL